MFESEIEELKDYLKKGEEEVEREVSIINDKIEIEYSRFFSKFEGKEVPESLQNEYKNSIREIFMDEINEKMSTLREVANRISYLEQKYAVN